MSKWIQRMSEWGWMSEYVNEWVIEWVSEWMDEGMKEWVNEWLSEWVRECVKALLSECLRVCNEDSSPSPSSPASWPSSSSSSSSSTTTRSAIGCLSDQLCDSCEQSLIAGTQLCRLALRFVVCVVRCMLRSVLHASDLICMRCIQAVCC